MSSRWNHHTVVVPREKPTGRVVMVQGERAEGDLNSQHRVTTHPAGFRVRERGAIDGTVVHQYRCPVHGVFDEAVDRADVPEDVGCPEKIPDRGWGIDDPPMITCGKTSPWAGSLAGQGHASGEVTC